MVLLNKLRLFEFFLAILTALDDLSIPIPWDFLSKGESVFNIETPQTTVVFGQRGLNREHINFFATTSMARVLVFALIVVFLQFRPAGLFPQKGRTVEA